MIAQRISSVLTAADRSGKLRAAAAEELAGGVLAKQHTALLGGGFYTTRDSDAPLQSSFRLGGFTRLSGYEFNELVGQHAALLYGVFYRQMWESGILPGYGGVTVEFGNVFQNESDIRWDNGIFAGSAFNIMTPAISYSGALNSGTKFSTLNLAYFHEAVIYN